jgi:abhydrolase domain-containing protein 1/3
MSSTVAIVTSALLDTLAQPLKLMFNDTSEITTYYQALASIPILAILREHVAIISITLYLAWYIKVCLSRTELVALPGSTMHKIADKLACVHTGYRPTIWCFSSSLNTIVFNLIQKCVKHHFFREVLKTPDGGQVALDWANLGAPKKCILLVLPGLTGSSKDNYVTHLMDKAVKRGCTTIAMNYRGIELDLTTPRTYCATNMEDLHLVVNHIHSKYPEHKIFAVGVSLGGIKLGQYLAKTYDDCLISHAMIVSAPMNVFYSCEELEKTQYFFTFNRHLTRGLNRYFSRNMHHFVNDDRLDCKAIAKVSLNLGKLEIRTKTRKTKQNKENFYWI